MPYRSGWLPIIYFQRTQKKNSIYPKAILHFVPTIKASVMLWIIWKLEMWVSNILLISSILDWKCHIFLFKITVPQYPLSVFFFLVGGRWPLTCNLAVAFGEKHRETQDSSAAMKLKVREYSKSKAMRAKILVSIVALRMNRIQRILLSLGQVGERNSGEWRRVKNSRFL